MADEVKLEVVQADRELVCLIGGYTRGQHEIIRRGEWDDNFKVQAAAAHRIDAARQTRDDVVETCARVADAWCDAVATQPGSLDERMVQSVRKIANAIRTLRTPQTDNAAHADGKEEM